MKGSWRGLPVSVKEFKYVDEEQRAIARNEIHILEHAGSPYIIRGLGVVTTPIWLGIIFESTQYGMLDSVIVRFTLSRALKLRIALEVARGLAFLHARRIVLRNLRTNTIACLSLQPSSPTLCRIAGLGSAVRLASHSRGFHDSADLLRRRDIYPRYSAPEILMARETCGPEVDVYSFACVFYELWNEELAFPESEGPLDQQGLAALTESVVAAGRRPVLAKSCPQEVRALVERCWAADPAQRPSLKEVVRVLTDAAEAGEESLMSPPRSPELYAGQGSPGEESSLCDGQLMLRPCALDTELTTSPSSSDESGESPGPLTSPRSSVFPLLFK